MLLEKLYTKNYGTQNIVNIMKILFIVSKDILIVALAWFGAFWLRYNLESIPAHALEIAFKFAPVAIVLQLLSFYYFGVHRTIWQFASIYDGLRILKSCILGCCSIILAIYLTKHISFLPRSIIPNYLLLIIIIVVCSRLTLRFFSDYVFLKKNSNYGIRTLVIGAGKAGEGIVRDILRSKDSKFIPVAFLDDNCFKHGKEIHGVRVVGNVESVYKIAKHYDISHIILAIPSATNNEIQTIFKYCQKLNIPISTLPSIKNIVNGKNTLDSLRFISIEDLIGREEVAVEWEPIKSIIADKVVVISGAGGSIGSELSRQIARLKPKKIIALDICEFNLFTIESQSKSLYPNVEFIPLLVDVRDHLMLNDIFNKYLPDIVFHAAAYKHVPILENQLRQAVSNNVIGTYNLAKCSLQNKVGKFVLVSSDKAVNPTNIMGMTKRLSEIICQNLSINNPDKTKFVIVRFGNVIDSAGSVVPIFRDQIAKGGPITVTHKNITRYFMTIPEASQLILQSVCIGNGGEIFVLDMGEPVKIKDLAEQMIKLSGKELDTDIKIVYTGLRPGEKMHEELFHESEELEGTSHEKILKAKSRKLDKEQFNKQFNAMVEACRSIDNEAILESISKLVPEYNPSN